MTGESFDLIVSYDSVDSVDAHLDWILTYIKKGLVTIYTLSDFFMLNI